MARYRGLHLAAFAVADAAATHARLANAGFRMQPLVDMRRPVGTADGEDIAAFSIVRPAPGEMPEGRIQALTHRTEHTVWQQRWLSHPNGATGAPRRRHRRGRCRGGGGPLPAVPRPARGVRPLRTKRHARPRPHPVGFACNARSAVSRTRNPGTSLHLRLWRRGALARRGRRLSRCGRHCLRPARRMCRCAVPRAARHRMLGLRRKRRRAAVAKLTCAQSLCGRDRQRPRGPDGGRAACRSRRRRHRL